MNMNITRSSSARRGGIIALLAVSAIASPAIAVPVRVQARQDQSVESSFDLDFGVAQGGVSSALISRTEMELEIDGLAGTARFVSYDQDIDALTLPGGLSTGAIRVQIVPDSSTGTYNRATGAFVTNELYSIEFAGDLSAYGLFSPVILPSQSVGAVDLESSTVGRVTMNWAGSNIANQDIPIDFSYICSVFASFSATAASYVEIEMVPLVSSVPMPLQGTLMTYLNSAIASFALPDVRSGVNSLRTFILKVQRTLGSGGTELVAAANTAIALAENRLDQVMLRAPQSPHDQMAMPMDGGSTKGSQDSRIVR